MLKYAKINLPETFEKYLKNTSIYNASQMNSFRESWKDLISERWDNNFYEAFMMYSIEIYNSFLSINYFYKLKML